MAEQLLLLSFH